MTHHVLTLWALLLLSPPALAAIQSRDAEPGLDERAHANAEGITDAAAFVREVEFAVEMAGEGVYGRLPRGTMARLQTARDRIVELLADHASATDLPPPQRIELYNAQEVIRAALNHADKQRMVCRREASTGSRLSTTECLTVAEREARARVARYSTDKLFRDVCYPGVGNPCTKN